MHRVQLRSKIGWIVIVVLAGVPVFLWLRMMPWNLRFGSRYAMLTSLGDMASLTGLPLFALSTILSGRFRFMEDFFGGMNRIYVVHHLIGGIAFILILAHPIFLALTRAMISYNKAALFLVPGSDWSINFGIFALYSFMILLVITYYLKLPYHIWKWTHKFMGVALLLGGIHASLIDTDIARNNALRIYMLGLVGVALLVYIYRTLLGEWLVRKYSYVVTYCAQLTPDVWKIEMKPLGKTMNYHEGQFLFIQFLGEDVNSEWHPFSISSANNEGIVDLIIKAEGDFTKKLGTVKPGVKARIEGPFGRFYRKEENTGQIWIAGGIGITPFLSRAKSLEQGTQSIDLYYVVRGAKEAVGYPRLLQIVNKLDGFRVCLYDTTVEKGRISAKTIQEMSGDLSGKEIYICGPPPMMKSMRKQFRELRVEDSRIHTEEFNIQ